MARFKSISEVIDYKIQNSVQNTSLPLSSPLSLSQGEISNQSVAEDTETGVFVWGYSTWGVDNISGYSSKDS